MDGDVRMRDDQVVLVRGAAVSGCDRISGVGRCSRCAVDDEGNTEGNDADARRIAHGVLLRDNRQRAPRQPLSLGYRWGLLI